MGSVFFFKQKTAYEMRISDWSSDVCSSDLQTPAELLQTARPGILLQDIAAFIGKLSEGGFHRAILLCWRIRRRCSVQCRTIRKGAEVRSQSREDRKSVV